MASRLKVLQSTLVCQLVAALVGSASNLGDQDATVAATGVTAAIDQSGRNSFDIGYHMPMNANVTMFARYGEQESERNFR